MPSRRVRAFVALWPGERTRAALAAWQGRWRWSDARSTPSLLDAFDLHATLHFLGAVDVERLPDVAAALAAVTPSPAFALRLRTGELWRGGIAVALPLERPPALLDLHARVGAAFASAGFMLETRPYRPHVTFARRAAGVAPVNADPPLAWPVRGFALACSAADGARRYRVIARFGGRAGPRPVDAPCEPSDERAATEPVNASSRRRPAPDTTPR